MSDVVISTRVRLARNFDNIPFRTRCVSADSKNVVERVLSASKSMDGSFEYISMHELDALKRIELVEKHLISPGLSNENEHSGVLIRDDHSLSIMINEEDHLRIQAIMRGMCLLDTAELAFSADNQLQDTVKFAFDEQLGFLTACPTNTGTGLRASYMLHLPLLALFKQMGTVTQIAAKLGLTVRGIYGEGSQAEGNIFQLSNQVTLGRTEDEIMEAVTAVARQVIDMEGTFRQKVAVSDDTVISDQVFRSFGLLKYARRMPLKEFMLHWSNIRLGTALDWLPITLETTDMILTMAQPAHIQIHAGKLLDGYALDEARAEYIRSVFEGGSD